MKNLKIALAIPLLWAAQTPLIAGPTAGTDTEPKVLQPDTVEFDRDRLRSMRAEYLVTPQGTAEGNVYYQHIQLDRGFHRRKPAHMIHWIGIDLDNTVNDLTTVDAHSFALVHRFMPQNLGRFISLSRDMETGRLKGSVLSYESEPTVFEVEDMPATFSLVTFPFLLASMQTQAGDRFALPIMAMGRAFQGTAATVPMQFVDRGEVSFETSAGEPLPAKQYDMTLPSGLVWSYYVTPQAPYFLGLVSRIQDGAYDIRYTGRSFIPPVSGDDRLEEIECAGSEGAN